MAPGGQPTRVDGVDGSTSEATRERKFSQLKEVCRAMTRISVEQFGRGPERVHRHYAGPDAIVCFLEDTLTPVERGDAG